MTARSFGLTFTLIAVALSLLSACEPLPPPGEPGRLATAELQIAGAGTVRLNDLPAQYGQRVRPGDSVEAGPGASALVAFSDGTTVQLDERSGPVDFRWGRDELVLDVHGSLLDVFKGAAFRVVRVITDLAEAYVYSEVVVEVRRGRFTRFDLFDGRLELVRPANPRWLHGGEYVQIQRGADRPEFGLTPPSHARRLRDGFRRWNFTPVAPLPPRTPERRCRGGQIWDRIEQICVCPPDRPHLQGGQCITCVGGMVWTGRQCDCPPRTRWDGRRCERALQSLPQGTPAVPAQPLLTVPGYILCPRGEAWSAEARKCLPIVQ